MFIEYAWSHYYIYDCDFLERFPLALQIKNKIFESRVRVVTWGMNHELPLVTWQLR